MVGGFHCIFEQPAAVTNIILYASLTQASCCAGVIKKNNTFYIIMFFLTERKTITSDVLHKLSILKGTN